MSIDEERGEFSSVTKGDRALKLFTDRYEFTRLFVEYLNDEPPQNKILFFHGDGGNGKSLLLKHLRQQCCKRLLPQAWQYLKGRPDIELANYVEKLPPGDFIPIPAILHNFGQTTGIDRPQDPFYGLLMLRRNLADAATALNYRLRFSFYDFACIWYLHQTGKSVEEIKSLFPLNEIVGAITTLIDAAKGNSVGAIVNAAFGFFSKDWGERLTLYLMQRGIKPEQVEEICRKDPNTELIYDLPRLLAQDLNVAMQQSEAPKRLVMFFDTHEAFWGQQKGLAGKLFFEKDEWLRRLLRGLDLKKGIVVVVAGREPPRWAEAGVPSPGTEIPDSYLMVKQVEHLSDADAKLYLQKVGIVDAQLCQALIAYANVKLNQVHPLYLGLGADIVLEAESKGNNLTAANFQTLPTDNKAKKLIEQLLSYADDEIRYAVHALSACRTFNFDLYRLLGESLNFQYTKPSFNRLTTRFSFVKQVEQSGRNFYHIHDLIRRLNNSESEETTRCAHEVLKQHYQEQGEQAEAIYHLNRLDWEHGARMWVDVFEDALRFSRYDQCRTLLEVRSELMIHSDFQLGLISKFEGDYFAKLARYDEAEQEYREAIAAYNQFLQQTPGNFIALNNKGNSLASLGYLHANLSHPQEAVANYHEAFTVFDQALQREPDYVDAFINIGLTLINLSTVETSLSNYQKSITCYRIAIDIYSQVLQRPLDQTYKIYVLNNKGLALTEFGELQFYLSQHESAVESYDAAILTFDQALKQIPNDIYILSNKGKALQGLGELRANQFRFDQAEVNYRAAIDVYNQALQQAPYDVGTLTSKGTVLQSMGELQVKQPRYRQAVLKEAIAVHDLALQQAPNYLDALSNKGIVLQRLGELQVSLSKFDQAIVRYQEAIVTYDQALQWAPKHVDILSNKGSTLQKLGELQVNLSQLEQAAISQQLALITLNRVLQLVPENIHALNNKGNVLQSIGDLQVCRSQYNQAIASYQAAINAFDQALQQSPNYMYASNKGNALIRLGILQRPFSLKWAMESWQSALATFSDFLELDSDNAHIRDSHDRFQECLDGLSDTREHLFDLFCIP